MKISLLNRIKESDNRKDCQLNYVDNWERRSDFFMTPLRALVKSKILFLPEVHVDYYKNISIEDSSKRNKFSHTTSTVMKIAYLILCFPMAVAGWFCATMSTTRFIKSRVISQWQCIKDNEKLNSFKKINGYSILSNVISVYKDVYEQASHVIKPRREIYFTCFEMILYGKTCGGRWHEHMAGLPLRSARVLADAIFEQREASFINRSDVIEEIRSIALDTDQNEIQGLLTKSMEEKLFPLNWKDHLG